LETLGESSVLLVLLLLVLLLLVVPLDAELACVWLYAIPAAANEPAALATTSAPVTTATRRSPCSRVGMMSSQMVLDISLSRAAVL
jgi:hypothetical protein